MPHAGIHGISAILGASKTKNPYFAYGFGLGAIAPDFDTFLVGLAIIFNLADPYQFHRALTHSFVTVGVILLLNYCLRYRIGQNRYLLIKGFCAGATLHIVMDVFLIFANVRVLWPLGALGVSDGINLWAGAAPPSWLNEGILLAVLSAFFYALFLAVLSTRVKSLPWKKITQVLCIIFLIMTVLLFWLTKLLPPEQYWLLVAIINFPGLIIMTALIAIYYYPQKRWMG